MNCKVISGLTEETPKNLVLDAGAFFKNYDVDTDTFEDAVSAKKLLGATKGGGNFSVTPAYREIEVDGARGRTKGMKVIDSVEVKIGAKVVEVTPESIGLALGAFTKEDATNNKYEKITGKLCLKPDDYIENITWVGNLAGNQEPVIIQVYNALNEKGLEVSFEDKGEAVIELEFFGHLKGLKPSELPFAIYYPKAVQG